MAGVAGGSALEREGQQAAPCPAGPAAVEAAGTADALLGGKLHNLDLVLSLLAGLCQLQLDGALQWAGFESKEDRVSQRAPDKISLRSSAEPPPASGDA